jgi:hypothetical protein
MIPATIPAVERPERERCAGRGGRGGQPVSADDDHDGEHVRGDHLQQEQPADGRNGPVSRQVQVQMNSSRGDQ